MDIATLIGVVLASGLILGSILLGSAPFSAFIDSGTVLSMGTFSKIMAPGLRLGWIESSVELRAKLLKVGFGRSGGSINHFTSGIIRSAIELGLASLHWEIGVTIIAFITWSMKTATKR